VAWTPAANRYKRPKSPIMFLSNTSLNPLMFFSPRRYEKILRVTYGNEIFV
jgi:hypothetical protein